MSSSFKEAFIQVQKLVGDFKTNETFYLSSGYQEAEVRHDFIDKFLVALGWDVNHDTQKNPYEQEVKVERKEHGVSQRRADYAFYVAPNFRDVKFYVEAKKPYSDIATADNYFQTIRYAWNSQAPIAALFNFAQFEIIDCRYKPNLDTALQRRLKKFHYSDFCKEDQFAEIYWLFSRAAVAANSLEKYAATLPKKRGAVQLGLFPGGYQNIDDAFLEELDSYRNKLAHIFKNSNPQLDGETLTEITQRTLDRLVFIRFLEDKMIEPHHLVSKFGERGSVWGDFIATSRRMDGIYNGIVFKKNSIIDSPEFKVNDDQFGDICEQLAHINSPYDFNAIPIHILGSIYERFLGKVIVTTEKRARVEEKPEVRKAGGVYYTPEYIVHYIVENTIGKLIKGKSPLQIAELKFADIACGSGSFLLGVYDLLIRYHTKYYNDNPGKAKRGEIVQQEDGIHLSLQKKREILVNNIFGVDIDNQAVEVAQLSLYLKLLQNETPSSARGYQLEFQETLLPSLGKNVVCGNSLIGTDISIGELFEPFDERKLNAMDYGQRFPEIMKRGGFDAVVGNPPYVIISKEIMPHAAVHYLNQLPVAEYKTDLFHLFLQKAIDITKQDGLVGYIVPNPWLTLMFTKKLRHYLLSESKFTELVVLEHQVFKDANVHTCLVFLEKGKPASPHAVAIKRPTPQAITSESLSTTAVSNAWQSDWVRAEGHIIETRLTGDEGKLVKRLLKSFPALEQVARASLGCQAYNSSKHTKEQIESRVFHSETKLSEEYLPELAGNDVGRYEVNRVRGKWIKYGNWLHDYRTRDWLEGPRILIREISGKRPYSIQAAYLEDIFCNYKTILNVNPSEATKFSMKYLLGILNSRLISFLYPFVSNKMVASTFPRLSVRDLKKLPIRDIDFTKPADIAMHDTMVLLVEQMLLAREKLVSSHSDKDKDFYANKCASLDLQMDALVFELYDLSKAEIDLIG